MRIIDRPTRDPDEIVLEVAYARPDQIEAWQADRIDLIIDNVLEAATDLIAHRIALEARVEIEPEVRRTATDRAYAPR